MSDSAKPSPSVSRACAAPVPARAQGAKGLMRSTASANGSTTGGWHDRLAILQQQIGFVAPRVMDCGGARLPGFGHRRGGHGFQRGHADQRNLQRQPQAAHEGQPHPLAGEGARPGGDGEAVKASEIGIGRVHRLIHHRRQRVRHGRVPWPRRRWARIRVAFQQRNRTGAERGIDGQSSIQSILQASSKRQALIARASSRRARHSPDCRGNWI